MADTSAATALLDHDQDGAAPGTGVPAPGPRTPVRAPRYPGAEVVARAERLNQQVAPTLLRAALGVVFAWFGALKLAGASPVEELVAATLPFVDVGIAMPVLGVVEVVLGLALAAGVLPRLTLLVLAGHLSGTFLTFLTASDLMWQDGNPLALTTEGEFVAKNVVFIAAALVLIAHHSRRAEQRRAG